MRFPYHGAGIALVLDGKVLVGRRSDKPFHGLWSIPGGCREKGLDADDRATAIREFREETEIDVSSLDAECFGSWTLKAPFFSWTTYFYRIGKLECAPVPHEFYELKWLDPKGILRGTDKKKHFRPFTKSEVRCLLRSL